VEAVRQWRRVHILKREGVDGQTWSCRQLHQRSFTSWRSEQSNGSVHIHEFMHSIEDVDA
jgi:hypothetical protein